MATERRRFLAACGITLLGGLVGPVRLLADPAGPSDRGDPAAPGGAPNTPPARLLACRSDRSGAHFATLFSSDGQVLRDVRLPARGHGIAVAPDGRLAMVFARRPGDFLTCIDLVDTQVPAVTVRSPGDRHFYGHGAFSADGRYLYATENDFAGGHGVVGVYDVPAGLQRIGEFASHGIGPHELRLLGDGRTLVVANGGIRTHPDMPRAKLNLDAMRSTLAFLDSRDGTLLHEHPTPAAWPRLSIRHLDVTAGDRVALVMQYQGPRTDRPPLVALQHGTQAPDWLHAPEPVQTRMRNYCGSVAFAADGERFAVTSPRGSLVTLWSAQGDFLAAQQQPDVCGVAAAGAGLWFSDGHGRLRRDPGERKTQFDDTHWDNHMTALRRTG